MRNTLLSSLSSLLLPLGFYGAGAVAAPGGYQRSYLSSSMSTSTEQLIRNRNSVPRDLVDFSGDQLDIQTAHPVRELVIMDGAVAEADKLVLRRALKPGVQLVELSSSAAGLPQLINALAGHKNLAAVHVVSHAETGAILLGNSRITAETIQQEVHAFAALKGAVRQGGDLLFYGCDLAADKAGEELLDIISHKTALDSAASNNLTGNSALDGDWDLEVKRGAIEAELAFTEKSLKDFSGVLTASNGAKTFTTGDGWVGSYSATMTVNDFVLTAKGGANVAIYGGLYAFSPNMAGASGNFFYVQADGTNTTAFELTAVHGFEAPVGSSGRASEFTNVRVVGYLQSGGTVISTAINGTGGQDTFLFDTELASFSGQKIKGFKLLFDCSTACNGVANDEPAFFSFNSFTITGAVDTPPPPTVTDARISIAGATGTGGAYKIGDTITATWNNTAGGDNSSGVTGVTVDFSQFGGGAAVVATNNTNTWTATYTIAAGAIDTTARNVSVTATNTGGSDTTADSTNATVDNVAPTVTDGRISISGATGTSGAYKIGDTVTATWNNTAGGDNNSDTISSATVNFTQFGGGAAVAATNSSGTWTATYSVVAGAIDTANLNVSVTATDNAGNTTAAADTSNATVDNIAPSVSSIGVSGSPGSGDTSMAFTVNFSESVANVSTDDFTLVGTGSAAGNIASVSAASGTAIDVNISGISGTGTLKVNLNASTNVADDAGNTVAAFSSGSTHSASILTAPGAPTIGTATAGDGQVDVTFTAPGNNGGSAITTYTATASPDGAFGTCAGPAACTATVSGLTNGTAYTFTVTATNGVGTSLASAASAAVTPKGTQTITFTDPGAQNFGTAPTLSGSATSGLTVTFSSSTTGICTITSGGVLTFVTAGTCTIDADQAGNSSWNAATTVTRSFTVNALVPNAPSIGTATAGDTQASVTFTAPASTGGAAITGYTVTSNPGGITAGGNGFTTSPITVTGLTNGVSYTFTVTATNSAGTGSASGASNSIIPAAPQTITFNNPGAQSFGTTPTLSATSSAGGGYPVSFTSSTTGVCTITSGGALTFVTAGTCTIDANQAGDSSYLAATQVSQSFTVNKANQTITFTNPGAQNFGTTPTLSATATSALTVTFSSSTTGVCTITSGGALTFVTAGSCTIDADQAGDTAWNAATTAPQTFAVNAIVPGAPTIGTATPGDTQASVAFTAPASTGGAAIIASGYTVTANPGGATGTGSSSPIIVTGLTNGVSYTFTVTATNPAGEGAASAASNSVTPASPQTITFANPGAQNFGTTPTLTASSSAGGGYVVTFTSSTTGVCTVTGTTLTFLTAGTCTINADQSGDSSFLPASQVSRSFSVNPVVPGAPTIGTAIAGDTQASVAFVAPVNIGGSAITGYTVTVNPADVAPVLGASSPIVVNGLTNGVAYTFTVTADNVAGTGSASSASNSITPAAAQTITFANPGAQNFGTTPTLTATADSGLTPTFTSSTTGVCTITSVGALTFVTAGTCTINADQAGNGSYLAATQVSRSFTVNPVIPGAPTIGTATAGNASATVAFSAPANTGGTAITGYTVTANPGGATATGANSPVSVSGLTNGTAYTFTVTATNSAGTSSASGASNSVTPEVPNVAPVISGSPAASVDQDTAYSFVPTASDADGQTLTFSISNQPAWASFSTSTGALTGTPLRANVGTTSGIVISVSDGIVTSQLAPFSIRVQAVNQAPVISGSPATSVNEGSTYSFTPTASDVDTGTTLTFSISNKPAWASFDPASGALSGAPVNADVGVTSGIVISVSDGTLTAALPAFTLTVVDVNETPVISGSPATSVDEGALYSFTPTATDADANTTLTFSISNKPGWASFDSASGSLSGTPVAADVGVTSGIVISVSDGTLTAALPAFTLTVLDVNDAPVISGSPATAVDEGALYSFTPTATDADANTTLTFSISNKPGWASFDSASGSLSGTPAAADVGATSGIVISVSDGTLTAALPAFTLTVLDVNEAPVISGSPATSVNEGSSYSFTPTVTDADANTTLTFSISNKPGWANFSTVTGALTGVPGNADAGATSGIVISVSDGALTAALPAFTLTVVDVNEAPVISGSPATSVNEGSSYSFTPTATDADANTTLTFSVSNKPGWASFNSVNGSLSGTPVSADVGITSGIVISVSDGTTSASLPAFSITVVNVNAAPVITSTASMSASAGTAYSYTLTATDEDAGDTLTFSVATKPGWLSFNTTTGVLSGTPVRADAGSHAVSLVVTDNGGLTVTQNFSIEVQSSNEAPVVVDQSATLFEDAPVSLTLTAQDPDQDLLSYEIVTQPAHGSVTLQGAVLVYTPELNFNGTDSIGFIAKDAELSSNVATVSLTINAVNDNPVVVDDSFSLQRVTNNQYLLNVLANDSDVDGDTLTIDGASTSVGTVSFNTEGLTVTVPDRYVGPVSLRYTAIDSKGGRANANVGLIVEGGAAAELPVITVPADIEVNATALFTRVPIGTATAVDRNGRRLRVSLINGSLFFAPGEHIVYWQATDADGNTATKAQTIRVKPLVSLSKDQIVTEGSEVVVEVILNGPSPVYPVMVPYSVSGSAGANDHTLVSGVAEISSGLSTSIRFTALDDGQSEGTEDITITLDASVNRGSQRTSRVVVTEANIAPVVTLEVNQNNESRLTVSEDEGTIRVTATVSDANPQDQLSGVWDFGRLTNVTSDQTQLSFEPAEQGPGLYQVSYTATDNGTPNLSTTTRAFIVIRPALPTLGTEDTDGDLVPDEQEGFADSDGDGIPDYQDAIAECNVMPTELLGQTEFLAEGEPGVCLRLGTVAAETDSGGLQIDEDAVEQDDVAVNIGGIFDFIAYGLPEQGKSYSLVIPQRLPIPANAVYRKFNDVTGWVDFVSNERNSVSSTAGERGFCPPTGGTEWTEGLTEGHWCVQVRVEDGGPNDADGIANSAIVDPGGVAVELNGNNLPVAVADVASTDVDVPVTVNVLANDSDVDGDSLTISQAVAGFGVVTILADQQLSYTPSADFIGTDTVIYSITDGKGGTASSELVVTVVSNSAPVAANDVAATDDKTPILIAVLLNDTDEEGDLLTVTAASAVQGSVSIETDQRLRYTPKAGFDGVDTISYSITDGEGGTSSAVVTVTVRAYQDVVVDNKSSGGSMAVWMVMLLAGVVVLRSRSGLGLVAVMLLSFSPFSQSAGWYLQGSVGQSKADRQQSRLVDELPGSTITSTDDSDSSYALTLGYQIHPYIGVEMGILDLGEASSQIKAEVLTPEQYHEVVKAVSPVLVDGVTAAVRFTLWQNEQWSVDVPLGVLFWKSETESRMNGATIKTESDGTDLYLGVQLNYQLAADWKLGLGYQQLNLKPNDVNSVMLSLRYGF